MDDRQYTSLARQPSAALQPREQFWGMPKRGLAFLLANAMFWQPMWAQADGIVVSAPGTGLDRAGNGVPIVNIARPNGNGLSHNQFTDYNVGSNGVILNNATARTQSTQLGGIILGNPNLNGVAASTILNEVNGGNPSQLRGYTEVAGQSARVIVANPYGITCNGCGFINSPKVTLSTGKPIVENGRLERYQVDQGSVAIEGVGLNANNVDHFEIITRSAKINAEIQAKNLTIVAGRNDVNADTLNATARADDGSAKPQLAIDSSALGGMYAGAIKLVGTEAGVGVKLDGKLIASGGDIQLDANGRLSLAETSASGAINVKAASLDAQGAVYAGTTLNAQTQGNLNNQKTLAARDSITLNAGGQLTNNGIIEAGVKADNTRNATGDVSLTAQNLGNSGSVIASRNLTANVAQTLSNQGGTLSAGQTGTVKAATLDNQNKGRVLSSGTLDVTADKLINAQGLVSSNGNLTAHVGQLNNSSGELNSLSNVKLRVASLDNVAGLVAAGQGLDINASGRVNNRGGRLTASKSVQLNVGSLDNTAGRLLSDGALTASISAQLLNQAGLLSSAGLLTLNAASLDNRQSGVVTTTQAASLSVGMLDNRGGEVSSQGVLALTGTELDNSNSGKVIAYGDLRLTLERLINQSKGLVSTRTALTINAGQVDNRQGSLYARQGLNLDLRGQLLNAQGSVKSDTTASVKAAEMNNDAGQLSSIGALAIDSASTLSNLGGSVISGDTLLLKAGQVNNAGGRIASAKALDASVSGLDQQNGQLVSNTSLSLDLNHGQLNNQGGLINAPGSLLLKNLAAVNNRDGEISSDQAFSLNATSLDNSAGSIASKQSLNLVVAQALNNTKGLISAHGLEVRAASLDNGGGTLGSDADLTVNVDGTLTNLNGEISSAGLTRLNAMALNNGNGQVLGDNALNITLGGALDNRQGVLGSGKAVDIQAASLNNSNGGQVISDGTLTARISGLLNNQGLGEVAAKGALDLQTGALDNRSGRLSGNDLLTLHSDSLDNRGGNIRADKTLQLTVDQLDNRSNGIIAGKAGTYFEGSRLDNSGGLLTSAGPLTLKAGEVQNGLGRISSQTDLTAVIDTLQQQGGALVAQGNLSLTGNTLDNRNGGLVGSTKALDLQVGQIDNRAGELSAGLGVKVGGQRLDNSAGGKLIAGTDLELKVAQLINQSKGLIHAQGNMTLSGGTLDNTDGALASLNGLVITLDNALLNSKGLISSEGELSVNAGSVDNSAGNLGSAGALSIVSNGGLTNQGGSISTDAALTLNSASLDNSQKGIISGNAATQITTGALNNSQGGRLTSGNTLKLSATQVNNAAGRIASSQALTASVTGLDQQQGELFSNTRLSLDMNQGQLNNQGGLINASGALLLSNLKDVNNQGGEISSQQAFTLAAQNLDNSGGKLLSNQGLVLRTAQALNNARGVISAASLDSRSNGLDNSDGLISSRAQLDLNVQTAFDNQRGSVIADGALLLVADRLDNRAGSIAGKAGVNAIVTTLDNRQGTLISSTDLTLKASNLDNRQAGLIGATNALDLDVDDLDNRGGELSANADVTLVSQNLDNSDGGQVFAGQALKLTVDKLLNRTKGLLSAKTQLSLDGGSLDNSGGYLISQQNQRINLSRDLLNVQGQLSSEGTLSVTAANLTNTGGSLSSAADLTVNSLGRVENQGGELITDGALLLTSAALDNRQQGNISGKGAVSVITGAFDNSQNGRLNAGGTLNLTAAQVTNQDGGRIGSQGALTASVSELDQQGGQLFSNTSLSLDMNHGQLNNQNGLINAPGTLLLNNLNGVNNQGGEISSAQAFTLAAENLNNESGRLLSNQGLTLRITQALNNVKGMIGAASVDAHAQSLNNNGGTLTSRGNLVLGVDQQLDNQAQGLISAAQSLTLLSGDLNNQGGSVLAGGALLLDAMALNNSANGLINAQGNLTLDADSLDSSNGGEVSAKGDMNLTLAALTQNGGRLLGEKALTLNLGGHDLNNRNGLITAKGPLTVNGLRDLDNQGGEVSSGQSFTLAGRTLDNTGGKLISSNLLSLDATRLLNQSGLMSGWQGLDVSGTSLDNRNNGTLSSRNGDVGVTLSGALLNSGAGALAGQNKLTVSAASLDNSSGGILSSGGDQTLTVTGGLLNNAQGGLIDSGALLVMNAMTLGNAGGTVNAQKALSFTGTSLDNSGGNLIGNAAVTLDLLGALTNTNGKIASVGPLRVERATQINNQGGQIVSQGLLTLLTDGLDNRNRGTVAANDLLVLNTSGTVQNDADGLIYSQNGGVQIDAASLTNGKGVVQSQGDLKLTVDADIDNQSGRIQAKGGDVTVTGRHFDNRGGVLASLQGLLSTQLTGVLKNGYDLSNNRQGGIIQAQRLELTARGDLDNYGGRISAQTGDAIVDTRNFDNRNGGLYAKGKVNVTGNNFDNSGDNDGQIAGSQIGLDLTGALNNRLGIIESDSTLVIKAASLDNQTGQLRALGSSGKTNFQIGGLFDNRNGTLETANSDLTLNATSFQNLGGNLLHVGGGTFDISTANISNAGGSLVTHGGLTLTADNWTNSSVIQAGRLTINVNNLTQTSTGQLLASTRLEGNGVNWTNEGLIATDGTASLTLSGSYSGSGRYSSRGDLALTAASMSLGSAGSVASGGTSTIDVRGQLNNYGRMTSASGMNVDAGSINNFGTLGSSGNLRLVASSLLNQNGLIFSGGDMALRVNNFTNRFADVYGIGNVSISRDDNNGWSASIANISASIESGGDLTLAADRIENRKDVFEATGGLVSGYIGVQCYSCSSFDGFQPHFPAYLVWEENYQSQIVQDSASASLTAGRNFIGNGRELLNNASTISAANDLTLNLQNFTNEGAAVGNYSVRRSFGAPDTEIKYLPLWLEIMAYNAANDPSYDPGAAGYRNGDLVSPNLHVWNNQGVESISRVGGRLAGGEAMRYLRFGSIWVEIDGFNGFAPAHYSDGVRTDAPAFVRNGAFFENTITYDNPSNFASAVVQAGGTVHINATQNLTNSVVREGVTVNSGASRVGSTQIGGQVTPAVIQINGQLPPNLAQQQVNPLTLPGFSLPTGQNGLFRLSGQGGSAQQATQANTGPQSWSMSSASISTAQRQQDLPDTQARSVQIGASASVASSDRQLSTTTRQTTDSSVSASALNVSAPVESGHSTPMPAHNSGAVIVTQVGAVNVDGASPTPTTNLVPLAGNVVTTPTASQTVTRVQGLPDTSFKTNPQKYLIETNPVLTDLKPFMSSDYLLEKLGYDPDVSAKRLGDGFYEQRMIQEAVVARTGQRFIDGQTSNEDMFKYLMNNAIASKQELGLSMGVTLTSEQVAALTHDIVWLEEHVVNGEKVLVPVLYMAQVNNRLAPNGALIQGADVTLIAGQDLKNSGTLRATNNLSAKATNDLVNSGLVEAGGRLDLLAGNNIVNKAGGVISGRDVSLVTTAGDVVNERTITATGDNTHLHREYVDSAARIEAANDLSIKTGRDFISNGGVLVSGRDTSINAGRDVSIATAEQRNSSTLGKQTSSITQYGSTLDAGRDLTISAGRDLAAIASQIDAKRDVSMSAKDDLTLASAADEQHSLSRSKRVTTQEDHVRQVSTVVTAGGNVTLNAGKDLGLIASRVSAGDEAYLVAGANLVLQSAEDSDYSFYSKTKKSSSGKKFQLDETSSVTNVASSVTSGGNNVLSAGNDLMIKGSNVISEKGGVGLNAGNDVEIVAVTDSESARHERSKSKSSWGGLKSSKIQDKLVETQTTAIGSLISGDTIAVNAKRDATVTGSALVSTNDLAVRAGRDLTIDAAENTFSRTQMHKEKNRDLTGALTGNNLGLDDITGNQHLSISSQKHNGTASQTTLTGSTIGSSKGNVSLVAGGDLNVIASDLVSTKDMSLRGSNVTITAGMETAAQSTVDKSNSLAVGRVIGGAIIDTVNTIRSSVEAAKDADDPRLKAVKLAQAALAAYNLGGMASDADDQKTGFADKQGGTASNGSLIKIGTELANTHSKSTSNYASQTAKQSTLNAGATLSIIANGSAAENDGDLHVIGSSIKAANTSLLASNNIILESAQNTADWSNRNSNNKTAIGASFNIGQQNGFTLDLGAQLAKGMGNGSSVTQVNTTVDTGSLLLRSGGDTTLAGAQVHADEINALIDGNLNIISRQDTQDQKSKQSSGGFGASICVPPFCYGTTVAASANLAAGKMNSEYKGVTEQTGLFAGTGGYTVDVGKTTTLEGGVIASDASADKNTLITDRLIARDIKNVSEIEAQSAGISISGSYGGAGASASVGGLYGIALSESDKSHTRSAVSDGTIIVRNPEGAKDVVGLNRDTANANEKLDKPDEDAMNERIELVKSSVELVKGISSVVAAERIKEAQDPNSEAYQVAREKLNDSGVADPTPEQISQQVQRDYGTGSSFQKASQAVAGIVQGILTGDIGAIVGGGAAPYLAQAVKQLTEGDDTANLMAHAVLGAVLAKAQGGSALAGAAGATAGELIARQLYPGKSSDQLTDAEKQTVAALSTLAGGLSGALAGGGAFDAALGAGTAKNAVENNHLSDIERISLAGLQKEYDASCKGSTSSHCQGLSDDIAALIAKGFSVLKNEPIAEDSDFTRAFVWTTNPGDVVSCATSPNGYCVATDKSITTDRGEEWVLQPASFEQAEGGKARSDLNAATTKAELKGLSNELFTAGCGGSGLVGIGCQGYMAAGGENPITGETATNTERVMWGIQGLLNAWGLGGSILSGVAKTPVVGVLDEGAFAQVLAKPTKAFSDEGKVIYSQAAGRSINTVSDLTEALMQGVIKPSQIPLDYVVIDGQKVIANTRSSTALINAGIPKSQWYGVDKTGVKAFGDVTFDKLVQDQLNKNYGGSVSNARR
ncbi:hemagglutinin repeat-containing protein [Pseudomonas sp. St290]|uniref:two-partner secretion domain-containing protein n=1 Tax=Pseudomonas sp. St290 TaxID=1602166 RepID=UPI001BB3E201|nr:hemagglutinin repeat-containing protein [Pseudomonas sp. St290]BBH31958.1 filamentous hemagglutinin, intein-containing [Pseudomonas sp. St290]